MIKTEMFGVNDPSALQWTRGREALGTGDTDAGIWSEALIRSRLHGLVA